MITVGILGASGFIGNRAVEMLQLEDAVEVRPIVRTASSLEGSNWSHLDGRIANALDQSALQKAFTGCDVVVHSVLGSPGLIRGSVIPAYRAAQAAGVRRLIYLSTMCVHGQAPAPGTDESSFLSRRQPFPYNSAKIYAEQKLLRLRAKGSVEVVIFRPGIVFGPQSRWVIELADHLLQGTAYLVNGGTGICNTIYVDNLVHAIRLALTVAEADRQAFLVGEQEVVTWADFYRPVAEALGIDPSQIPHVEAPKFTRSWKQRVLGPVWDSALVQKTLSLLSDDLKRTVKEALFPRSKPATSLPPTLPSKPKLIVTQEMALLQQCQYKLPFKKAEKILNYEPIVSFPEASHRSVDWLASAGYPVISKSQ